MAYPKKLSKDEINALPILKYAGAVELIVDEIRAKQVAQKLMKEKVLGFDTETRPSFRVGEKHEVALLQLATEQNAYLFRLHEFVFPQELSVLLAKPSIVKSGVAVRDDIKALQELRAFEPGGFVDLSVMAKEKEFENFGLNALTGIFLGHRLAKRAKTSNWERKILSEGQVHYAAADAWVGLQIYKRMLKV